MLQLAVNDRSVTFFLHYVGRRVPPGSWTKGRAPSRLTMSTRRRLSYTRRPDSDRVSRFAFSRQSVANHVVWRDGSGTKGVFSPATDLPSARLARLTETGGPTRSGLQKAFGPAEVNRRLRARRVTLPIPRPQECLLVAEGSFSRSSCPDFLFTRRRRLRHLAHERRFYRKRDSSWDQLQI